MSVLSSFLRLPTVRSVFRKPVATGSCSRTSINRSYADKRRTDVNKDKHVVQVQGTENEQRVRVRRARPSDGPRVMRFVREHSRSAWPGYFATPSASHMVISDYVARALSQGHSMLAEQQESRRGWSQIKGLALGVAVCPWDASMLERWASCIKCSRSKQLMHFTAHCLRAPAIHEKYQLHKVLQVILIVSKISPKKKEIVQLLAKNAMQRGRDVGFKILRFDVSDSCVAKVLEDLKYKKEWQIALDTLPDNMTERMNEIEMLITKQTEDRIETPPKALSEKSITVYTALTDKTENFKNVK